MVFGGIKKRADTLINDRVTAPVTMAVIVSITAFILAGIALVVVVNRADHK
jgi:hypothetical protein